MDVHLVFSISKDASHSKGSYNRKVQFNEKSSHLKKNQCPKSENRNTLRGLGNAIPITKKTVYLAFDLYVET